MPERKAVERALDETIRLYPNADPDDRERHLEALLWLGDAESVIDIGGGYSPFAVAAAASGMRAASVDRFDHPYFAEHPEQRDHALAAGVELIRHDATASDPLPFPDATFDAITSFDSLEHWPSSPRPLFAELRRIVRPRGVFLLGVPNAVNVRKRLGVLLGKSNWSQFDEWYFEPAFYGHVREPTVGDLRRIAVDLELIEPRIIGRNWLGYRRGPAGRLLTRAIDRPLRLRPSLCANIYIIGRFP